MWFWIVIGLSLAIYVLYQAKRSKRISAALAWMSEAIDQGIIIKLVCGPAPILNLHTNEEIFSVFPRTTLKEPRAIRTSHGTYGGPSIRIAKGLSYRFGSYRSTSESHEELRSIDRGTLVLTNYRLIFVGQLRTASIELTKIVKTGALSDAAEVHVEGQQKPHYFFIDRGIKISFNRNGKIISAPVSGKMLKFVVDEACIYRNHPEIIGVQWKEIEALKSGMVSERMAKLMHDHPDIVRSTPKPKATTALPTEPASPSLNEAARSGKQTVHHHVDPQAAFALESENARALVLNRPQFWEVLLVGELLKSKLLTVRKECHVIEKAIASMPRRSFAEAEFCDFVADKLEQIDAIVGDIDICINKNLPASLGETGVPGKPVQILRSVDMLVECCRRCLAVEVSIRTSDPPRKDKLMAEAFQGIAASLLGLIEQLAAQWHTAVEKLSTGVNEFNVRLKIDLPQIEIILQRLQAANQSLTHVR